MARVCCYVVGAKGIGGYGGYETFLDKLTEYHQNEENIEYHIACKKNGVGAIDERNLSGAKTISEYEFVYHNAYCFKIASPEIGSAQAILYDLKALRYCIRDIKKRQVKHPIIYVLSSRIGPFMRHYAKKIHKLGGVYYNNPDGREDKRSKYSENVKKYWRFSERLMVKYSDLVICDSKNIEKRIKKKYDVYRPKTIFIAYGAELRQSSLLDDDKKFTKWLSEHELICKGYYLVVGRFVPENNFETMIREFMRSNTEKNFVLITNVNEIFLSELESKLHFKRDQRIKFVGTVYDQELLMKIRENAYGYFHGHEVGGTNPSLLEALSSTDLNLLYDVGFNREVAENTALYWTKETGNLAHLIEKTDKLDKSTIQDYAQKAKQRISDAYTWEQIADKYKQIFVGR